MTFSESDREPLPIYVGMSLEDAERVLLLATLDQHAGNKRSAAHTLGVNRKTVYSRLRRYAADGDEPSGPDER
jgi:DNA-binding NtrC family response regulator